MTSGNGNSLPLFLNFAGRRHGGARRHGNGRAVKRLSTLGETSMRGTARWKQESLPFQGGEVMRS
jgi:hypothetical protein